MKQCQTLLQVLASIISMIKKSFTENAIQVHENYKNVEAE